MEWDDMKSAEECRKGCQEMRYCDTFSYVTKDYDGALDVEKGTCYMKNADLSNSKTSKEVGIISGPRESCNPDGESYLF